MSDTNRVQIASIVESSFATKETGSNLQIMRLTGESLKLDAAMGESAEMRSDRQTPGIRRTRVSASGGVNVELSYGTYDDWLEAALMAGSTWSAPVTVNASTISALADDNSFSDSGNGFGSLAANQWVYISGFTGAAVANNGFWKIATAAAGKITVTGGTVTTAAAGDSVTITQGGSIVNATALTTFNLERKYADLTGELSLFVGMAINGLSLTVPQEGIVTGSFDFLGADEQSLTASAGSGYDDAATTDPFSSLDVTSLLEDQTAMTITSFSLNLQNNLRTRLVCGSGGVVSIGTGKINLTGTLQAYYETKTLYDKFVNETASALAVALTDPAGNRYVIEMPRVKFSGGQRVANGPNGDVMADMQWTAYRHATEDVTIRIARFAA
jgi:hypothetical protein